MKPDAERFSRKGIRYGGFSISGAEVKPQLRGLPGGNYVRADSLEAKKSLVLRKTPGNQGRNELVCSF